MVSSHRSGWYFSSCLCRIFLLAIAHPQTAQPTPSSTCGLQITCTPCWLERKCALRKLEHPSMLERLLTRTTLGSTREHHGGTSKLEVPQHCKKKTFSAALCLSMYLVCVSDEHLAKTLARLSGTLPHILHMVLIWSEVYRSYKPCKLGLIRVAHKVP